jgi:hypothetical protein
MRMGLPMSAMFVPPYGASAVYPASSVRGTIIVGQSWALRAPAAPAERALLRSRSGDHAHVGPRPSARQR